MQNKIKRITSGVVATSVLLLTGCSTVVPYNQTMNLTCNHDDAVMTVDGVRYNLPAQVKVRRNRDVSLQCYKDGYVPCQRTIGHHLNGAGCADIIGGLCWWIPFVGVFMPGAWSLDETNVAFTLYEK